MSNDDVIAEARKHVGTFALSEPGFSAASVASALVTAAGNLYTGVCFDVAGGIGFCAEHAAVAAMRQGRETVVAKVVAVTATEVLPPCGRCRELLVPVDRRNLACEVIVGAGRSGCATCSPSVEEKKRPTNTGRHNSRMHPANRSTVSSRPTVSVDALLVCLDSTPVDDADFSARHNGCPGGPDEQSTASLLGVPASPVLARWSLLPCPGYFAVP